MLEWLRFGLGTFLLLQVRQVPLNTPQEGERLQVSLAFSPQYQHVKWLISNYILNRIYSTNFFFVCSLG